MLPRHWRRKNINTGTRGTKITQKNINIFLKTTILCQEKRTYLLSILSFKSIAFTVLNPMLKMFI